jgi:predicted dehydrogenase
MQPVRWGILGISGHYIKKVHLPVRESEQSEVVGIASRSREKAEAAARNYDIPRAYGSYDELLADPDIEAVYNPLPNHMHVEWVKRAADAGKHILCEKPLGLDADEVQEAIDYCRERNVLLMEAFMYRFHPQWKYARDLIHTGNIGTVRAVQSSFFYDNEDPQNIRNRQDAGGGGLYDIGCYCVSTARYLLGAEPHRVVSLVENHPEWKIDMLSSGLLDFGGAHASFTVGTQNFPYQFVTAYGSGGIITVHIPFNTHPDVPVTVTVRDGIDVREVAFGPEDHYGAEFDAFSRAVRAGGPVPTPPEDALNNQRVLDALFASGESGTWVKL